MQAGLAHQTLHGTAGHIGSLTAQLTPDFVSPVRRLGYENALRHSPETLNFAAWETNKENFP
jgi:hypothetical protein